MAVLSLALGIGLNTAMFSVVNAVLLAPTAVREPERLVEIYTSPAAEMPYLTTSYPDFLDLRAGADAFSGMAAHAMVRGLYRRGEDRAEIVLGRGRERSVLRRPRRGSRPGARLHCRRRTAPS